MDAKEAVKTAKTYVSELLAEEGLINLGLEELEYDDAQGAWSVTIGFSRPWNNPAQNALVNITGGIITKRSYRVIKIRENDGQVISFKRRDLLD